MYNKENLIALILVSQDWWILSVIPPLLLITIAAVLPVFSFLSNYRSLMMITQRQ